MQPNWDYVKKTTLWNYEDLIDKLKGITVYPLIWQAYNHDMVQAARFACRLFAGRNLESGEYPVAAIHTFGHLQAAGVINWGELLSKVTTRSDCMAFIEETNLDFENFIDVLNYLLRWGFPFQTATRELLNHDSPEEMAHYVALKQNMLMNSFDLVERGYTNQGRLHLAALTGLPQGFITTIIHRADIARLPYVRRKTILPVCGAGYDTLAKIAAADLEQFDADMKSYFQRTQNKSWDSFKSVIVLNGLVVGARALPVIVEG
jgi:hypothetical protein